MAIFFSSDNIIGGQHDLKRQSGTKRTYPCYLCGRVFHQLGNLKLHFPVHTGEAAYACSICNKRFNRSSNLYRHMRNIHNL